MKLLLTSEQRLNLVALIGAQQGTLADLRAWWKIQDKLELSEAEAKRIGLQTITAGSSEVKAWQKGPEALKPTEVDLEPAEIARLRDVVERTAFLTPAMRAWLEPLIAELEAHQLAKPEPRRSSRA